MAIQSEAMCWNWPAPYAQRIKSIRDLLHGTSGVVVEAGLAVLSLQEV
ncbi:uncharacterized protein METZ01_LOCUS246095, partial [marine metagenome]